MRETELALKIIDYYSGWDIYKEVPSGGIIDIVCKKENVVTSIECKMQLNFDVIGQAYKNIPYVNFSYIAVPERKTRTFAFNVCKDYGIGILFCSSRGRVEEVLRPKYFRHKSAIKLEPYMKKSEAGSQNNRVTAFKNTIDEIEILLKRKGGRAHITEIFRKDSYFHYSSCSSARQAIKNLLQGRKNVIENFYFDKGFLILKQNIQ